ncbi:hypothetical protein [Arthrobacter sp. SLBN-53]|uniref:hypothetical protein n=1 Tax=Arthrobacter sp. SLBN-53 TaxID=2768412 RepID=UPI001172C62E|nr:hypothetical protein [Arthrobacter sp. SLBN-53]TQK32055.1 Mce-associated membrane protein [Arthrobacter sp. SLBN-53]
MTKNAATTDVFDAVRLDEARSDATADAEQTTDENHGPDPDGTADGTPPPHTRRLSRRRAAVVLVTLGALGSSIYLGYNLFENHRVNAAADAALHAARDYALTLTTLDSAHLDDNYTRTLDGATGEFKDAYSQGATQLRQILIDNKATGTGIVVDAAVKSATVDRVEVLLFVDQSITNLANPSPRIDRNRIAMTMQRNDGRWLASKVDIL